MTSCDPKEPTRARDHPLRVVLTTRALSPFHGHGGLERHVHELVRHLLERRVSVTIVAPPPTHGTADGAVRGRQFDALADDRFRLVTVPYRTFPFAGRRGTTILDRVTAYPWFGWRAGHVAADLVQRQEVDIVHGMGASVLGYAFWYRRHHTTGVPYVLNPHGLEEFGSSQTLQTRMKRLAYRPLQAVVRTCAASADRVIATDRALIPALRAHLGVPETRAVVLPNAIAINDVDRLGSMAQGRQLRQEIGIEPSATVLLSIGRLEHNKGFQVLARALATLSSRGARAPGADSWRWVLVGEGPYRASLERLVSRLGLGHRVTFLGRVTDVELHSLLRVATLFVHPTLYEGSSIATLEAMAHGRAVVATAAGGLPDKVRPGLNGWLVSPGDPAAMVAALEEALATPPQRLETMGQESRRIVEQEYSWDAVSDRTVALYRQLVAERRTGARPAPRKRTTDANRRH